MGTVYEQLCVEELEVTLTRNGGHLLSLGGLLQVLCRGLARWGMLLFVIGALVVT
jgi:hypothetical protein